MKWLRKEKEVLKKQMKSTPVEEQICLEALWRDLKAKHSALSRAESASKRRNQKKKTRENFFKDPFKFARQLFQQPRAGAFTVQKKRFAPQIGHSVRPGPVLTSCLFKY
ncbi:reverse transcriptase [Plakobranchus ocellatus]|uniref:Reverse transcriptase n=1 Tax=Plakobranchus ocellatus TaxID=259542 RepID=A0AAV4C4C9_9GAST|nr:reverse transcriptase [Plakobranchus ocellatus]